MVRGTPGFWALGSGCGAQSQGIGALCVGLIRV